VSFFDSVQGARSTCANDDTSRNKNEWEGNSKVTLCNSGNDNKRE